MKKRLNKEIEGNHASCDAASGKFSILVFGSGTEGKSVLASALVHQAQTYDLSYVALQ